MPESKENLKKRIDTNKNQHIENNEVDNFIKNKNNWDIDFLIYISLFYDILKKMDISLVIVAIFAKKIMQELFIM